MLYILYYIAYLLSGSVQQSPWKPNQFSASPRNPPILWKPYFHYNILKCLQPDPILSSYQWINPGFRHQFIFHNMLRFYCEGLFASHPTHKLEYHSLSAVCDSLFYIFAATLHFGGRFSICNLRTCHVVVTCTHLSWLYCIQWWIYYNRLFRRYIVSMYNKHCCLLSSWYISFLGSSGNVTYHILHLPLQILCFKIIKIVCRLIKIFIFFVSKCVAYICMLKRQSILKPLPANVENMVSS